MMRAMLPPRLLGLLVGVLAGALLALTPLPAQAAASELTLTLPKGYAGERVDVGVRLVDEAPVAGATVAVWRRVHGGWRRIGSVVTDADGRGSISVLRLRSAADNVFLARYAGDGTHAAADTGPRTLPLAKRTSVVTLSGPRRVVDERAATLRVEWLTAQGEAVAGAVRVLRRAPGGQWRQETTLRTNGDGRARLVVRPRVDSVWRVVAQGRDWVTGDLSGDLAIDNVPPGDPVRMPKGAPRPRVKLPRQARAVGSGPNAVVQRIPNAVWRSMAGRSWHAGCPVGRAGLRLVRVNYWGYDGYRYRGEVVAATGAADNMAGALAAMYRGGFPIRAMYRVDRFGWSKKLKGANDYRSMAAGNTSAFNCRDVVNRPGVRSPHSYGRSLDVNTWENPYRSATGLVPNSWWQSRSHPRIAWRSGSHGVVRIMRNHGFHWTYGLGDTQHFDVGGGARKMLPPACRDTVCH